MSKTDRYVVRSESGSIVIRVATEEVLIGLTDTLAGAFRAAKRLAGWEVRQRVQGNPFRRPIYAQFPVSRVYLPGDVALDRSGGRG